jgi:hypothetical protein
VPIGNALRSRSAAIWVRTVVGGRSQSQSHEHVAPSTAETVDDGFFGSERGVGVG